MHTYVVIRTTWVHLNLTVSLLPPVEQLRHLPIFRTLDLSLPYGAGVSQRTTQAWLQLVLARKAVAAHPILGLDLT